MMYLQMPCWLPVAHVHTVIWLISIHFTSPPVSIISFPLFWMVPVFSLCHAMDSLSADFEDGDLTSAMWVI
jgi:hypothetical protein